MSEYSFQFEELPNELINDLFQYFHTEELFRIFYNLNIRFNNLIKSMNYLSLRISKENYHQINHFHIFSPYLYTLLIDGYSNINFALFNQIRHLILIKPTNDVLRQFDLRAFDHLKHLNLKHLILRTSYNTCSTNANRFVLKDLFACIPNLEKLSLHRRDNISIIQKSFIKYDWFSSLINSYFLLLRRIYCYFHLFQLGNGKIEIGPNFKNILDQIIANFDTVHPKRYQARLIID